MKFALIAFAILPDHMHLIIDPKNNNLSSIVQKIKLSFSKKLRYRMKTYGGNIWQKRFWDHIIRNQDDLNSHLDYIHYNPVKHGFANNPLEWEFSSIQNYYEKGYYSMDWGTKEDVIINGDFGE
jgi:putative transposase